MLARDGTAGVTRGSIGIVSKRRLLVEAIASSFRRHLPDHALVEAASLKLVLDHELDVLVVELDSVVRGLGQPFEQLLALRPELRVVGIADYMDSYDDSVLGRVAQSIIVPAAAGGAEVTAACIAILGRVEHVRADLLSSRQIQVLRLVANGYTNSRVAGELHIREGTVKRHLSDIFASLGASSRLDAVNRARQSGLFV